KTLEEQRIRKKDLLKQAIADEEIQVIEEVQKSEESAARFQNRNQELKAKNLLLLRDYIREEDSAEDILKKVLEFFPDYTLADDALEFLLDTTYGTMQAKVKQAKDYLNTNFPREIKAGRNINFQAHIFSKEGLGTPQYLRDLYRDITGNPRTAFTLFDEFASKFPFDTMKIVIRFLLHSLGADMKSKGPSIERAELMKLMDDTQNLQAILNLYRFFKKNQPLIEKQYEHFGLKFSNLINFENLAKQFINILKNRYVSPEKIIQLKSTFGIDEEIASQIIVLTKMKDAVRNTSIRLYKSDKHREDILYSFLEALEELEQELQEEENE
ncbi:MAG: hypothetical protein A3F40_03745, partial [Chlamydiae bacterium RIFCSPHIGHO2_12_FULL_27_8]